MPSFPGIALMTFLEPPFESVIIARTTLGYPIGAMILPLLQISGSKRAIDAIMYNDIDPTDSMMAQDYKISRGEPQVFEIAKPSTAPVGYCSCNYAAHTPIRSLLALTISGSLTRADSFPTFNNEIIFQSSPNYTVPGTQHAKTLKLADGSLLATWENYSPKPPLVYFPTYKSIDGALTWHEISRVTD
jgi:hypothetical protein